MLLLRPHIGNTTRIRPGASVGVAAGGAPTLLVDLEKVNVNNLSGSPASDGESVGYWQDNVGGRLWTSEEGAHPPVFRSANGIHTDGGSNYLITTSAVTIPASTDFDMWLYCTVASGSQAFFFGANALASMFVDVTDASATICSDGNSSYRAMAIGTTVKLVRISRTGTDIYMAATGIADALADANGVAGAAITFDTMLAYSDGGGGVDSFGATGNYIQAARIVTYSSGYAGRAAYRSTYETAISGAPL